MAYISDNFGDDEPFQNVTVIGDDLFEISSVNADDLPGEAIQILKIGKNRCIDLDEEALKKILFQVDIKDLRVAVISIAGAFRKGKSFMLDFFLRYLRAGGKRDWLGNDDEPLTGFSWSGGMDRVTTGILLWSQVFKVQLASGEKIAVLLMDTQGMFDCQSTVQECACIFALSTMISSLQIYNLSQGIDENNLGHLQLFTEYGRLALQSPNVTPFQNLLFLIRDWYYAYNYPYGNDGGQEVLKQALQFQGQDHSEMKRVRENIQSCFSNTSCYLMPHPGLKVANNQTFNGKLSDIERDFKHHLCSLVPSILHPDNLVLKQIGGEFVKAEELFQYIKAYIIEFQKGDLPSLKSILEANAEASNRCSFAKAKMVYNYEMTKRCGPTTPYVSNSQLERFHSESKAAAHQIYKETKTFDTSADKYQQIDKELEDMKIIFYVQNTIKNTRWPSRKFSCLLISLCVSIIFSIITLGILELYSSWNAFVIFVVNMMFILLAVSLILLAFRCGGKFCLIASLIDTFGNYFCQLLCKRIRGKSERNPNTEDTSILLDNMD